MMSAVMKNGKISFGLICFSVKGLTKKLINDKIKLVAVAMGFFTWRRNRENINLR